MTAVTAEFVVFMAFGTATWKQIRTSLAPQLRQYFLFVSFSARHFMQTISFHGSFMPSGF